MLLASYVLYLDKLSIGQAFSPRSRTSVRSAKLFLHAFPAGGDKDGGSGRGGWLLWVFFSQIFVEHGEIPRPHWAVVRSYRHWPLSL